MRFMFRGFVSFLSNSFWFLFGLVSVFDVGWRIS